MKIPTILDCPLWAGPISRRVAKKYINRWGHGWMFKYTALANLTEGDIVNDCSGQNSKILRISPEYISVGTTGRCFVLYDVDLQTEVTGCSLCHCGVEPAQTVEVIEARLKSTLVNWTLAPAGKMWYGKQYPKYEALAKQKLDILNAGGHIVDETGRLYPQYSERGLWSNEDDLT